jgi:hypothetical protein
VLREEEKKRRQKTGAKKAPMRGSLKRFKTPDTATARQDANTNSTSMWLQTNISFSLEKGRSIVGMKKVRPVPYLYDMYSTYMYIQHE